tara:strand:- start:461 stop:1492 length:1032 start_codon:yes stop_codon:yes gene_type:complete
MEQYKINSIFTNIVRSSEDRPLAFVDIPSVLGNARTASTIGGTLGFATAGDLWNGLGLTDLDSIEISPSQVYSEGFTFTQSSMDNSVFWSEMLIRIPIQKLVYFQGNSYPEEMLFNLLIDEFFILKENGDTERLANNFTKPSYEKFRRLFKFLIERIEIVAKQKEDSSKSNFGHISSKAKGTGEDLVARICISEKPLSDSEFKFHTDAYCEKGVEKEFGKDKLVIILRSVKGIFEYLGQVVEAQSWDNPIYVDLKEPIDAFGQTRMKEKLTKNNSKRLFVVERDSDSDPKLSYAFTEDMHGNRFIIPSQDAGYSKKVVSFLSELLILINVPGSAAPQPGVLIR